MALTIATVIMFGAFLLLAITVGIDNRDD